jgi:hypothetical protein
LDAILANAYLLKGQIHDKNMSGWKQSWLIKNALKGITMPMPLFWQNNIWMNHIKDSPL